MKITLKITLKYFTNSSFAKTDCLTSKIKLNIGFKKQLAFMNFHYFAANEQKMW